MLDLPAEFYLETVDKVFQAQLLAKGQLHVRGERVDLAAIRRTALLTVEGDNDDICAPGQTVAAHDLCRGLPRHKKRTTCRRAWATTASSAAGAGSARSTPASTTSSSPTTAERPSGRARPRYSDRSGSSPSGSGTRSTFRMNEIRQ